MKQARTAPDTLATVRPGELTGSPDRAAMLSRLNASIDNAIREQAKRGPPREPTSFYELNLVPRG